MITDVEVEDYQAVRKASIRLARFTVVTGPTGSGKSAVLRAIRLVAFNARGTAYIRHGAKTARVALGSRDENWAAAIHRGGRGSDKYVLTWQEGPPGPDSVNGTEFTKLEGKVPEVVAGHVSLKEINFAGQFDRPFLLSESGSQVARVLGELTNVTLVFDAAREANRRKLETARDLRTAEARLAGLKEQGRSFLGLRERLAAAERADASLMAMGIVSERMARLESLLTEHEQVSWLRAAAASRAAQAAPPSGARLAELLGQWKRLHELEAAAHAAGQDLETASDAVQNWQLAHIEAEEALHSALIDAGTCPVCGQDVAALWRDSRVTSTSSSRSVTASSSSRMALRPRSCGSTRLTAARWPGRRRSSTTVTCRMRTRHSRTSGPVTTTRT